MEKDKWRIYKSVLVNTKRYEPKKVNLNKLKKLIEKIENNGNR